MVIRMRGSAVAAVVSVLLATLAALPSSATATDGTIQLINPVHPVPLAQPPIRGTYQTMGKGKGRGSSSGKGSASGKGKGSKQTHQLEGTKSITLDTEDGGIKATFVVDDNDAGKKPTSTNANGRAGGTNANGQAGSNNALQGKKTITFDTGDTYTTTTFVVDDNDPHHEDSKDAGNSCGDSCVDSTTFLSSMGLPCRGHTDFECALFVQVGFTKEEVEELITNCPCSCQACPTAARAHTPSSSSTTAPVSSSLTSPPKGVEKDDVQNVAASERSFWNTSISSSKKASKFTPLIIGAIAGVGVLAVVLAAAMLGPGQRLFHKRSATSSGEAAAQIESSDLTLTGLPGRDESYFTSRFGVFWGNAKKAAAPIAKPGMAVFSVSRKRRRAKVKDAKEAPEAETISTCTYSSSTTKPYNFGTTWFGWTIFSPKSQVENDEESAKPSIEPADMTVTEDDTVTGHYKERKDILYSDNEDILCPDREDMLCCL